MNGASVLALVRITDVDKSYTHLVVSGESLPEVQEAGLSHVNWCGQVLNIYMLLYLSFMIPDVISVAPAVVGWQVILLLEAFLTALPFP